MSESIGRRMLRKQRDAPVTRLPPPSARRAANVDKVQLRAAVENARTGAADSVHTLAALLIDADRTDDPDLAEFAVDLLSAADSRLWKNLDQTARQTWWDIHDWAAQARDRISGGETSTLALVVASSTRSASSAKQRSQGSARSTTRSRCPCSRCAQRTGSPRYVTGRVLQSPDVSPHRWPLCSESARSQ